VTGIIREGRHWRTAINRTQDRLGKTILVLRRHEESVAGLTGEEWADLRGELRW
jgi:diadenosine tetraphosphate (Ap4A) HIT family hydrolase